MLDNVFGAPTRPLLVHAVVVGVPLAAPARWTSCSRTCGYRPRTIRTCGPISGSSHGSPTAVKPARS